MGKLTEENQHVDSYDGIPVMDVPTLGDIIKEGRQRRKLTQTEFACKTNTTNADVSRAENSITKKPSKDFLKKISPYVGYSYTELLPIAGYSTTERETIYYNTQMKKIDYLDAVEDIYRADADLLEELDDLYKFATCEDTKLLKLLLKSMRRISTCGKDFSDRQKEAFLGLKGFLLSYLPTMLEE